MFSPYSALRPLFKLVLTASLGAAFGVPNLSAREPFALAAQLPPASTKPVDFARDIKPIFDTSCVQCHAHGKAKGSFSLETRADFLLGGDTGPPAIAGKSGESPVIEMISGLAPDLIMPQKGRKLTRDQVATFRAWIDQGLPWPEEITFFKPQPANLAPREITLPAAKRQLTHPIDRLVDRYFSQHKVKWGQPVNDRTYARRVWLDTIGLLPPAAELEAFVTDPAPDKRERLVQRLLADDQQYAEHWISFWNDLLRNDYKGTGYIDGGRKQITGWLYTALARNLPYDQFVAQLLNPNAESEGFTKGILWRGAVNASMVPPMQAAQGIAQVFLGVNLKCASCHDSFINAYTLEDAYGLASIYASGPLEIAECDVPTGHTARVKFLYSELGTIDATSGPEARKAQLAEIITGQKNGRLPRTVVNRLWQRLLGYGLVEPVDEMDKPSWSPELLDWLAGDLVAHDYNLKHTLARILTSRTYQLPAVNVHETEASHVFRGPAVRRLSAEQFADAIMAVVGSNYRKADTRFNRQVALGHGPRETLPLQPQWIWATSDAATKARPATVVFKREVVLAALPTEAALAIAADDNHTVKINGKSAATSGSRNSTVAEYFEISSLLRVGSNTFEVTAVNLPIDDGRPPPEQLGPEYDSPAGLLLYARIRSGATVSDLVSDASWSFAIPRAKRIVAGTPPPVSSPDDAPPVIERSGLAVELGGIDLAPWRLGSYFLEVAAATKDTLPVERAALVAADPLMAALGRPNREQIVTVRSGAATTLQALELTNGGTLATILRAGAARILAQHSSARPAALITTLYQQTLSRPPTRKERSILEPMLGDPVQAEGVEDLLWSIAMLPEFQLIY